MHTDSHAAADMSVQPTGSRTSDYDYALPDDRIAQQPVEPRDASRLLVLDRTTGTLDHRTFRDLADLIPPTDALVVNTTRVFRARLLGHRDSGGQAEILLLRPIDDTHFEAMVHPGGKLRPGRVVTIAPDFRVEIVDTTERRTRIVRLLTDGDARSAIERYGHVPLPPYIARGDAAGDVERYQTVFAREEGSVAAPTAGLHFTPELLAALSARGVHRAELLLHVGAGTFKPVEAEDPAAHLMHEEWYQMPAESAALLDATRAGGGRICAVGTTSLRTLESVLGADGRFRAGTGETSIFIRPPHRPRSAELLVTNFHLPRSTLLMLVAAMAGYELTMHAYDVAVREGYRFYSYGDAMLIRP